MNAVKAWAVDTGIRALKTAGQSMVALMGTNTAGLTDVDWANVVNVGGLAFVVTVLHNLATLNVRPRELSGPVD